MAKSQLHQKQERERDPGIHAHTHTQNKECFMAPLQNSKGMEKK